jgi:hypothetical protein
MAGEGMPPRSIYATAPAGHAADEFGSARFMRFGKHSSSRIRTGVQRVLGLLERGDGLVPADGGYRCSRGAPNVYASPAVVSAWARKPA